MPPNFEARHKIPTWFNSRHILPPSSYYNVVVWLGAAYQTVGWLCRLALTLSGLYIQHYLEKLVKHCFWTGQVSPPCYPIIRFFWLTTIRSSVRIFYRKPVTGSFRNLEVGHGRILSDLVGFDWIWPDLVGFARLLTVGKFGRIWSDYVEFGRTWSNLVGFGRIWSALVRISQIR